ncbi:MAG: hypothetical protein PVI40_05015 [Chlamydiota bacterium]|jgi:tetratricopeptide (TPR) repeat protein
MAAASFTINATTSRISSSLEPSSSESAEIFGSYIPRVIIGIIDDFAPGTLLKAAQLNVQSNPPHIEEAKAISGLVQSKLEEYTHKSRLSHYSVSLDEDAAAISASNELADFYGKLGESEAQKKMQTISADLTKTYKEEIDKIHREKLFQIAVIPENDEKYLETVKLYCNSSHDFFKINDSIEANSRLHTAQRYFGALCGLGDMSKHCLASIKLASTYLKQGELRQAFHYLLQAECVADETVYDAIECHYKIAALYLKLGNSEKASEFLNKAKSFPFGGRSRAEIYKNVAILFLELEMETEAEEFLEKAKSSLLVIGSINLYVELSLAYADIGNIKQASSLLEKGERIARSAGFENTLFPPMAAAYIKIKNIKKAEILLSSLTPSLDNDGSILLLVDAYKDAGDEKAVKRVAEMIFSRSLKERVLRI